jgi:hypothetical protein
MDEYISREALGDRVMAYGRPISRCVVTEYRGVRFEIGNWVCDGKVYFVIKADGKVGECMEMSAQPTADVVEVRRGKWKLHDDGSATCSECGCRQLHIWDFDNHQNFCGVCGADMRWHLKDGAVE